MIWNLTCRKVRRSLALWAGSDLDEVSRGAAQRHLAVCPDCRDQWQRLQAGQLTLERLRSNPPERKALAGSVWPAVERQIRAVDEEPIAADWRGWLPTGALAAACLTAILIVVPGSGRFAGIDGALSDRGPGPVIYSRQVGAPVLQVEGSPLFDHSAPQPMSPELPRAYRVRTLLDGTDVRRP
jgi:hypothetical protein